jgi:hypothetical protein
LSGRETSFDALADLEAAEDLFIRVQFDRAAADGSEEFATDLARLAVDKRAAYGARLIGPDVPERANSAFVRGCQRNTSAAMSSPRSRPRPAR